ncbi:hypothetical protein TIFTF001_010042 [Ficus carica]|uniref:Uncharacterized protein n=1 Tax=Ficus carica TaxID=3494 RepID=A0AA88DHL6_FICCA|nr:hypothetical protein TIFTF001_010042 [Ficus carica]
MNGKRNGEAGEAFGKNGEEDEKRRLSAKSAMNIEPEIEASNTISASSTSLMASENLTFALLLLVVSFGLVTWVFNGF